MLLWLVNLGFAGGGEVVAAEAAYPGPAGKAKRRRRRTFVVVDGHEFEVSGPEEAEHLLNRAVETARQKAVTDVSREVVSEGIEIDIPEITTPAPSLERAVLSANHRIAEIYREARVDAENIRKRELRKAEQDEEDAILALLL